MRDYFMDLAAAHMERDAEFFARNPAQSRRRMHQLQQQSDCHDIEEDATMTDGARPSRSEKRKHSRTSSLARALRSRTISECSIRWSASACCGPTPTAPTP